MTGARNPILHEQSVSSSSADPERSTTHPLMEDKLTIPIDILAPSSSDRRTDRHQTPPAAAASPLSPENSISHPCHHFRPPFPTAVGGIELFSVVSQNVLKIVFLTENSGGVKRPPSC